MKTFEITHTERYVPFDSVKTYSYDELKERYSTSWEYIESCVDSLEVDAVESCMYDFYINLIIKRLS